LPGKQVKQMIFHIFLILPCQTAENILNIVSSIQWLTRKTHPLQGCKDCAIAIARPGWMRR
jgi:hypothetical protein